MPLEGKSELKFNLESTMKLTRVINDVMKRMG